MTQGAAVTVAEEARRGDAGGSGDGGGGGGSLPGAIDPITPFAQGASMPAGMSRPFYGAFSQAVSPAPGARPPGP
ncbi:hypothetical protein [Streptomyces collinus]|uniref:hypothetical protein n=1 Tax=Streptomyces collinus TaxID=42684 RepID=UPI00380B548B